MMWIKYLKRSGIFVKDMKATKQKNAGKQCKERNWLLFAAYQHCRLCKTEKYFGLKK